MPGAPWNGHELQDLAVATNQHMRRHPHALDLGEIRMLIRRQVSIEQLLYPRATELIRRQADVVHHDQVRLDAGGPLIAVRTQHLADADEQPGGHMDCQRHGAAPGERGVACAAVRYAMTPSRSGSGISTRDRRGMLTSPDAHDLADVGGLQIRALLQQRLLLAEPARQNERASLAFAVAHGAAMRERCLAPRDEVVLRCAHDARRHARNKPWPQ